MKSCSLYCATVHFFLQILSWRGLCCLFNANPAKYLCSNGLMMLFVSLIFLFYTELQRLSAVHYDGITEGAMRTQSGRTPSSDTGNGDERGRVTAGKKQRRRSGVDLGPHKPHVEAANGGFVTSLPMVPLQKLSLRVWFTKFMFPSIVEGDKV